MPKIELDHQTIKGMKSPDKPIDYFDEVENGLILRLSKAGTKTFAYRYRFHGKNRRYKIGRFPGVSLSEARRQVQKLRVQVNEGIDPQAEKEKAKQTPDDFSFSILCDRFSKRHLPTLRKRTKDEYQRIIDKELVPKLGRYPASEISRKQIVDLLDAIAIDRDSPTLSNRVRAVLSSIFSFGIDKAIVEANPVLNVRRKKKETKRERTYSPKEIKSLWEAFEGQDEPVQSIFKMLMICGQRSAETRRMKWADVDRKKGVWTIPADQTKANRTHLVPLPEMALQLLEKLHPWTGSSDYVFQSPVGNQPIEWLQKAVKRIRKASGVSDFRIHDLRRTAASHMAKLGIGRTVLGKVLNHKGLAGDDTVTSIYDRHSYTDEKRHALTLWSKYLQDILDGKKEAKVYEMR